MTDYHTLAKLKRKGSVLKQLDGSPQQSIQVEKKLPKKVFKEYTVLTEDSEFQDDFYQILKILNLKKEDLPIINQRYYSKEFIQKNWLTISGDIGKLYTEDTEEELEDLIEYESKIIDEDWPIHELDYFNDAMTLTTARNNQEIEVKMTDIRNFEDYENAFVFKPVHALVFEDLYCGNIPAYFFGNFKKDDDLRTTYMSTMFNINDIDKHFLSDEEYAHIHLDEIYAYKKNYHNSEDEEEPYCIFAFG